MQEFDSIIIGSGQAAPSLAVGLARRGDRVALIEGDRLGGTCVNTGCTPTKTLRKSARVAHLARELLQLRAARDEGCDVVRHGTTTLLGCGRRASPGTCRSRFARVRAGW